METPVNLRTYLTGGSIFTAIKAINDFPFFAGNEATDLDLMLSINYGQKPLFSAFINIEISVVANHIVKLYGDKWTSLINFNSTPVNLGATQSVKTTGNQKTVGSKTDNADITNKVSAFNSDDLLVDSGSTTDRDENSTVDVNKDSTVETFNIQTAFNNLPLVEKTNIINTVLKDVATYLTISLY